MAHLLRHSLKLGSMYIQPSFSTHASEDKEFPLSIVRAAMRHLKPTFRSIYDGLPVSLIRFSNSDIHIHHTEILYPPSETDSFFWQWKTASIVPYFKRGSRLDGDK